MHRVAQQRLVLRADAAAPCGGAAALRPSGGTRIAWPGATAVAGLGALAVDPDLPGAQQLFEPAVAELG